MIMIASPNLIGFACGTARTAARSERIRCTPPRSLRQKWRSRLCISGRLHRVEDTEACHAKPERREGKGRTFEWRHVSHAPGVASEDAMSGIRSLVAGAALATAIMPAVAQD